MPFKKYFIALVLPNPLLEEIEAIKQELFVRRGLKGALRCPAHITLHRPFIWKAEKEEQLISLLEDFKFPQTFDIVVKDFAFFEPRVIYINVLENHLLNNLHDSLARYAKQKMQLFNELEDLRAYKPHITIASRDLKKELFYKLQAEFELSKIDRVFTCNHISLLSLNKTWEIVKNFDI